MGSRSVVTGVVLASLAGCTHQQLERSTVLTTTTVMDIQYQIVLTNLAMMSCHPAALPSHIDLADGVVQVNDKVGFGQAGGFTTRDPSGFGIDRYGPNASRQVTEQWGADATTDPERLTELQEVYRVALGLPTLPPPNAIAYLREEKQAKRAREKQDRGEGGKKGEEGGTDEGGTADDSETLPQPQVLPAGYEVALGLPSTTSTGGGGSTPSTGSGGGSSGGGSRRVPIEILLSDVPPPGWFHVGCKRDVPKDALYVGRYRDRYAWVTAEGLPELSRFTVTVLGVVKLKPGEGGGKKSSLAVTQ